MLNLDAVPVTGMNGLAMERPSQNRLEGVQVAEHACGGGGVAAPARACAPTVLPHALLRVDPRGGSLEERARQDWYCSADAQAARLKAAREACELPHWDVAALLLRREQPRVEAAALAVGGRHRGRPPLPALRL